MVTPVQKPLRVDLVSGVRDEVKRWIVSGELPPGSPLRVANLASRLDVSSSPIREALRLLERDGLVEIVPFRGARVRPLDVSEVEDLYELREFLEEAAIRKVGPRFPEEGIQALAAAYAVQEALEPNDRVGFLTSDVAFHQAIVDMAGNKRMSEMFATLVNQGICFVLGREPDHLEMARQAHLSLLNAIRRGDTQEAMRVVSTHLRDSVSEWRNRLRGDGSPGNHSEFHQPEVPEPSATHSPSPVLAGARRR